jgi:hypothetical protein
MLGMTDLEHNLIDSNDILERGNRLGKPLRQTVHVRHHSKVLVLSNISNGILLHIDQCHLNRPSRICVFDKCLNEVLPLHCVTKISLRRW